MRKFFIISIVMLLANMAMGQAMFERPDQVLNVSLHYTFYDYTYSFSVNDLIYDPNTQIYSLAKTGLYNRLGKNLCFNISYHNVPPYEIDFGFSFDIDTLPKEMYGRPIPQDVIMRVDTSPLLLPTRDDYYMDKGQETVTFKTYDPNGGYAKSLYSFPSWLGMVDWWCSATSGQDGIIQGGLIEVSCSAPCWATVTLTILDWPMPIQVNRMAIQQEWVLSDMTQHSGSNMMKIDYGGLPGQPQSNTKVDSGCDVNVQKVDDFIMGFYNFQ